MILTTLLLAATLNISPERAVSPPLRTGSPYDQHPASAAATGDVVLLVWHEQSDRAAVRVDRNGRVLDAQPIALSTGTPTTPPRVARGAGGWMVVWAGTGGGAAIHAKFVRDDGSTSGTREFIYGTSAVDVSIAFDGTHYLVAWTTPAGLIQGIRLNTSGFPVEGTLELVGQGSFDEVEVAGFDGGGFAVVAIRHVQTPDGVTEWFAEWFRLDTNGSQLSYGWLDRTSTSTMFQLRVLADGGTLVAAWGASGGVTGENIFIAREGQPVRILVTGPRPQAIVKLGGQVYVVTMNAHDGRTELISEDGTERRTAGVETTAAAAASFGDRLFVGMGIRRKLEYDLSTAVVDAALQDVLPQTRLEIDPPLQERPAVARNAHGEALAVWLETGRRGGPAVLGRLLDRAGQPAGEPFVVGTVNLPSEVQPHVASDGTDFLVVWYDTTGLSAPASGVHSVHVLRDGTMSPPAVHPLGTSQLCLTWNGSEYLLGHLRLAFGAFLRETELRVARLSREGVQQGEAMAITPQLLAFYHFSCASSDAATLLAFGHATRVDGVILTDGGTATAPFRIGNIDERSGEQVRTAVAANGDTFLAAWTDYVWLQWALVSEGGTVSPVNESLELGVAEARSLAAAPFRNGFFLAWRGYENVLGLALDRHGRTVEGAAISVTPRLEYEVALAGGNAVTAVYQRDLGLSELRPRWRVFAKAISDSTPPGRRRTVRH